MAKLIYSGLTSLDGYVADEDGNFDWAEPDEEVHTVVNDLERQVGTYLYGRRMYEVLVAWENLGPRQPATVHPRVRGDLAGGRQGRVVHDLGDGLQRPNADRTSLRPRSLSADEGVGGIRHERGRSRPRRSGDPGRTGRRVPPLPHAHRGGRRHAALPDDVRVGLELLDERRFGNGVVHLHYRAGA